MLRKARYVTHSGFTTSDFFHAEGDALGSDIRPFQGQLTMMGR